MASLVVVESHEKRRKTGEEADGVSRLQDLPDALLVFIMGFLGGDFTCWASLLVTCRTFHNHYVDRLVKLKFPGLGP